MRALPSMVTVTLTLTLAAMGACGGTAQTASPPASTQPAPPKAAPSGFDLAGAHRDVYFWSDHAMDRDYYRFGRDGTFERFWRNVELGGTVAEVTDRGTWTQTRVGELSVESTKRCHEIEQGPLLVSFDACEPPSRLVALRGQIDAFLARNPGKVFTSKQIETIEPGNPEDALVDVFGGAASRDDLVGLQHGIDAFLASDHQHRLTFQVALFEGAPILVDDAYVRRALPMVKSRVEMQGLGVFFELSAAEFAKATSGATPLKP